MGYWKQWRLRRTKIGHLLALGVGRRTAILTGISGKSYWRLSRSQATQMGMTNDWAPQLQGRDEFVWRYVSLTQDTCQRAHFDFAVHGDDTAFGTTAHDDVASGLAKLLETQALQRPYYGSARNVRQFRCAGTLNVVTSGCPGAGMGNSER